MSNMSDEVASATLQVTTKAAETAGRTIDKSIDTIAKLLQTLMSLRRQASEKKNSKVTSTDLTKIKSGEVDINKLQENARKYNEPLSYSENAISAEDKKFIIKKAKEYGIPVAFTQGKGKDNIYANVRQNDLPIFKQICTEMMRDKISVRPQELGNFKCQPWEMQHIAAELNRHDLSAQFGQTKTGENFCLYEKKDEKAILIARGEFIRKCNELKSAFSFDKDEQGYYTIKNLHTGREISFENVYSRNELSKQLQDQFGFDENKANIACAKFGEECLSGEEKKNFFSDNPQNEFSKIDTNINLEGESIYCKDYTCWRLTPKSDDIPKIVYRDNEGQFVVLSPEKMTNRQMSEKIQQNLSITDTAVALALVDKANKVNDYYVAQDKENFTLNYEFTKDDFNFSNADTVDNMLRTDENGNTYTKSLPIDKIENNIERTDKNSFTITSIATTSESDANGVVTQNSDTQTLVLSFSDKKNGINELADIYKKQGMTEYAALQMAKDVYKKAEMQNPEKVVSIEEVRADAIKLSRNDKIEEIFTKDKVNAVSEISEKFDIDKKQAEVLLEKTEEIKNPEIIIDSSLENEKVDTNINLSEKEKNLSENISLNGHEKKLTDSLDKALDNMPNIELPDVPELPEAPPSIGGRR